MAQQKNTQTKRNSTHKVSYVQREKRFEKVISDLREDCSMLRQYCFYIYFGMIGFILVTLGFGFIIFNEWSGLFMIVPGLIVSSIFILKKIRLEGEINNRWEKTQKELDELK